MDTTVTTRVEQSWRWSIGGEWQIASTEEEAVAAMTIALHAAAAPESAKIKELLAPELPRYPRSWHCATESALLTGWIDPFPPHGASACGSPVIFSDRKQ